MTAVDVTLYVLPSEGRSGREAARQVLAGALGVAPEDVELHVSAGGKPQLAGAHADLRFSVAHSGDATVVALAHGVDVGVDAERVDRDVRGWSLARHVLTDAEREEGGPALLVRAWARKEAILKAAGVGLALDPAEIEITGGRVRRLPAALGDPGVWSVRELETDGHVVAVAAKAPLGALRVVRPGCAARG